MLKRSKSYFLFHYNDNLYIKTLKINKSLNDLSSLLSSEFNNKRKLISYSQFLKVNPKANKKQRVKAIQDFYNLLY
jgi:hypothetical protein